MAGKKAAKPKDEESVEEAEAWEEESGDAAAADKEPKPLLRMRDWRDVERYREIKALRDQVDDDFGMEEVFGPPPSRVIQVRPVRAGRAPKTPKSVPAPVPAKPAAVAPKAPEKGAKAAPANAAPAKGTTLKSVSKVVGKLVNKLTAKTAKPAAKAAPKAKKAAPKKPARKRR